MQAITQPRLFSGSVVLPADKSIGHRTALLSSIAEGTCTIENYPSSADPQSTLDCIEQLGIRVERDGSTVRIHGKGRDGWEAPSKPLDCGNSGTTMRLMAGMLAGQPFDSTLTGDDSLRSRPMARIASPLRKMGAKITLKDGHAPIRITGRRTLHGISYPLPVASAQVKSCVLLAGLWAEGETVVIESTPSRDHTERMLELSIEEEDDSRRIHSSRSVALPARDWHVPGDFSAAAFFLVAGSIVPDSDVELPDVGLNPTRNALLSVLRDMGADIALSKNASVSGEPSGTLQVKHSAELQSVTVENPIIPNLIDEIPVLAVAATQAEGTTIIRDARELRVKETDRISAMAENLAIMGAEINELDDGLEIHGPTQLSGTRVHAYDDHRIAMAMGVAGLVADGETRIEGAEHAAISFPDFWTQLDLLSR